MKHKKMQKKGQDDDGDDVGDINDDSDVTYDESILSNEPSIKVPGYSAQHLSLSARSADDTCKEEIDQSEDSAEEIDVVESDDVKS